MKKGIVTLSPLAGEEATHKTSALKRLQQLRERSQQQFQSQSGRNDSGSQRPFRLPKVHIDPHKEDPQLCQPIAHEPKRFALESPKDVSLPKMALDLDGSNASIPVPERSPVEACELTRASRVRDSKFFRYKGLPSQTDTAPSRTPQLNGSET